MTTIREHTHHYALIFGHQFLNMQTVIGEHGV